MPQLTCPGCRVTFRSHQSWNKHLAQTRNQACRAIYEQQHSYVPKAQHIPDHQNRPSPPSSPIFEGDFFGDDYAEEDFPGPWDDEVNPSDPPEDSDLEQSEPEVERTHILPVDPPSRPPSPPGIDSDSDTEMEEEYGRLLSKEERQNAEKTQWTSPVVQKFPGSRAGEAVGDDGPAGYAEYGTPDPLSENPYAPFSSQVDWQFAKWAKLRGPGSTSVSELLGIESVCLVYYSPFQTYKCRRYKRNLVSHTRTQTS